MNVTFTRARSKLIIFGSRKTLQAAPLLAEFFALMVNQGWILRLPKDADELHVSQRSASASPGSKRSASDGIPEIDETKRSPKKLKFSAFSDDGALRGRPILKDLINADKSGYR